MKIKVNPYQEIGQAANSISALAQSTRILALNGMIEAAKTGVSGRSFSSIANEIKTLAKETAQAAEEIREAVLELSTEPQSEARRGRDTERSAVEKR
jgi:methyl-accepting chemotaxis protein